jgi:DNA-binding MarR family transcriptional regulator
MSNSENAGRQDPVVEPGYRHGAGFLLATVGAMGERRWVTHLRSMGLHRSEYGVLAVLNETGDALRQRDVAKRVGMDPRNAVPIVASLISRGLLTGTRDPSDSRAKLIRITSSGRDRMRTLADLLATDRQEFFAVLEPSEYQTLVTLLRRVYEANLGSA